MSASISASGARLQPIPSGLRKLLALAMLSLLAACSAIPRGGQGPAPVVTPDPVDTFHRVALLLPVTGPDADVGQSIANATSLAMADTKVTNVRLITYDTALGVDAAARRAIVRSGSVISSSRSPDARCCRSNSSARSARPPACWPSKPPTCCPATVAR